MKISVIIVSYNCKAFLDYCLQSVSKALRQIDSEILVIDNCSTDGSVEYLKSKTYDIRIIENKKNLGFSKANNKAAKLAKGEYLFFLNPDTIIPEDLIESFFKNKKPNTLSGGEKQRVAIARAMINNPKIIFADEPTGNLDSQNSRILFNLFFKLRDDYDCSIVIVTHNPKNADKCDRKLQIIDGKIKN